ncbi:MAG: baseplate J/gp47 family protein [Flavonifractor plautii]
MYEDKTPEAIKAEILAAIRQSQGLSAMAGGFADGVAGPVAEQLSEAYRALEGVTSMLFVDESSGGYIDLVGGQYYNITRREGTRAYCDISFSGTPGLVIPRAPRFDGRGLLPPDGGGAGAAGDGAAWRPRRGSAYNVEAGAIDRMYVNLTGLTDYHSEAAAGGTDAESDAALLARVRERVQRPPTSGNGYQYRQWAMEVAGVGSAKVVELPGGPGTVGVTLVDSNDRAPSEEIVEAVTAHIEEERPIGAAVTVTAAGEREVTVAAQVSLTGGAGAGAVQDAFRAALAGYLHTLIEGKYGAVYYKPADDQPYTLLYNRVLALLLNVEGVENFASLTVNGGTADVTIQAGEIPVLGEVSVT